MAGTSLGLVVLRAADLEVARAFYSAIGLTFVREQHGTGPVHYSCELPGGVVLEIYPGKPGSAPDRRNAGATIIGLKVQSLDPALTALRGKGAVILTPPQDTPWSRRAVVQDPDGRAVELSEPS